jgi:hypothetical protein
MVTGRLMWYEWFNKNSTKWLWEDGCGMNGLVRTHQNGCGKMDVPLV